MNLVDRLKFGAKVFVAGAVVGAGLGLGASVRADGIPIYSFKDFVDSSIPKKTVTMPNGTNLEVLNDVPPASIVEKGSHWYMGFVNYLDNGGAEVVGYAENLWSDNIGKEGQIYGRYLETMGDGNRSDDVWVVHDGNGDGIGYAVSYSENPGTYKWVRREDDKLYFSEDIMFGPNRVYGDVSQLPVYPSGTYVFLPEMIIDDRFARDGPAGMNELVALAENWMSQDCHPYNNADCDRADWNLDGKVDLRDFSLMAEGWDPSYVSE